MDDGPQFRILTVCTHNRTRSVMIAAMLDSMLVRRVGRRAFVVESAGFAEEGFPPIPPAVDAMAKRGLDVSDHRSRLLTVDLIDACDLILTAERDHVVRVATMSSAAFARSMTLPRFVELSDPGTGTEDARGARRLREWVEELTADRTPREYLSADIGEIADPTGAPPRIFEAAVVDMQGLCESASARIAPFAPR